MMIVSSTLEVLWWFVAIVIAVPMAILVVESLAALVPIHVNLPTATSERLRCAVLVPAHNEELAIGRTVKGILAQLRPQDRLIVVADNCDDATAEAARAAGATVIERQDAARRGKGFALDYGVRFLESDPPDVVLVIDADCTLEEGAVDALLRQVTTSQRPVQSAYVMVLSPGSGVREQVSCFAFQYKNVIRPMGLSFLRLPCLLTGTGMAIPWPLLRDASLATGNIVEDMQLGLDLALTGHPPQFCSQARVLSEMPVGRSAAATQRRRWEHGHLRTLLGQVPRLVVAAIRRRRFNLLGLALELSVPPLSMLFLVWAAAMVGFTVMAWLTGIWIPAAILASSGMTAFLAIFAAWFKFGRAHLPLSSLLAAPFYALCKVPIYATFLLRPQKAWVRTERTSSTAGNHEE